MLSCRYEPRFDGKALGPDKHLPKSPCVAGAWKQFELMTLADKRMFTPDPLPCIDRDNDVKRESNGTAPNCMTQVNHCQSAEIGEVVRAYCPKTCGICTPTEPPTHTPTVLPTTRHPTSGMLPATEAQQNCRVVASDRMNGSNSFDRGAARANSSTEGRCEHTHAFMLACTHT